MWRHLAEGYGPQALRQIGGMDLGSGEGSRLIVCHVMSEDGMLEGADDVFIGQKNSPDYHSEMNGIHFEEFIKLKVLPRLPNKSLLVMDKASYHMRIAGT